MSKYNLIIYSLLLAAVPISVSADSSTTSAATVGMLSPPTSPSVGHRPGAPLSDYQLILNGVSKAGEFYIPIPGTRLYSYVYGRQRDPDTDKYQANETATTVCTYYRIEKDDSRLELLHEKPCKYDITIGEDDIGSKIRIEHYNETDVASASGYMPVPIVSEPHFIETKRVVKLSSDLSVVSADKTVLKRGESTFVTIIVKDINNNPIDNLHRGLDCAHSYSGYWERECNIKPGSNPGEYTQSITYDPLNSGRPGATGELRLKYKYFGTLVASGPRITGK
ncbi:hypothetical protein E2X65_13630 [Salmonella enterica]|nr:hypothetical protein [Salmonella enterica]